MKKTLITLLAVCLLGLQGCGGNPIEETKTPTPTAKTSISSTQPSFTPTTILVTPIIIDGFAGDWQAYLEVAGDPQGDQESDSPDLAGVWAFNYDRYFYLLIHIHGYRLADQYDILMDVNGGDFDYQVSVWPENDQAMFSVYPITNGMEQVEGVTSAQAAQIEVKIPLSVVGGEPVKKILVQTPASDGTTGDEVEGAQIQSLAGHESAAATELPSPTSSGPVVVGTLLDPNLSLQIVHPTGVKIDYLRVGLNNEIFTIDFQGDTIYQLLEDGSLVEHMRFPNVKMDYFNIAPDGTFWFVNNRDWGLYHVDDQGAPHLVGNQLNRIFDFDSAGNLFAVDQPSKDVQKITPDGKVEIIASGFQSQRLTVGPDDTVYIVTFDGELAKVEADGSIKVIASGFGIEDTPAFTPDGTLYVLGWTGLMKVDPASGKTERQAWFQRYQQIGGRFVFDQDGFGYIVHPNTPLYRMDLQKRTIESVYSPLGNSLALGVNPLTEEVFVAYGDRLPGGKTTLYRVNDDGSLEEIGHVPFGLEMYMTFGKDGTGYLAVADSGTGSMSSMIYKFNPQEGTLEEFQRPKCIAQGMAVDPGTGALWWTECNKLVSASPDQEPRSIPYFEEVNSSTIAIGSDGTFHAMVWFRPQAANLPMAHGIYRYENGGWVQLNDMTAKHAGITLGELAMCPDGHIYVGASAEHEKIPNFANWSTILRLEDDNSLTLIGYDLGNFDPMAITCAPSGTVYFTNAQGIYSIPNLGAAP